MKKALLTRILTPAVITILMLSCSGGNRYRALLDRADSLMAEHPDSAYALLCTMDPSKSPRGTAPSQPPPRGRSYPRANKRKRTPPEGGDGRGVLQQMNAIDAIPNMNQSKFLYEFNLRIVQPVRNNPDMLYNNYWKNPIKP